MLLPSGAGSYGVAVALYVCLTEEDAARLGKIRLTLRREGRPHPLYVAIGMRISDPPIEMAEGGSSRSEGSVRATTFAHRLGCMSRRFLSRSRSRSPRSPAPNRKHELVPPWPYAFEGLPPLSGARSSWLDKFRKYGICASR